MTTIYIAAHVDKELEMEFLEYIRAFDVTHQYCHFEIAIDVPDLKTSDAIDLVREAQQKLNLPVFGMVKRER